MADTYYPQTQDQLAATKGPHVFIAGKGYVSVPSTATPYPRWKFNGSDPKKNAKLVQNAEEEAALGEGWFDVPMTATPKAIAEAIGVEAYLGPIEPTPAPPAPKRRGRPPKAKVE